MATKTFTQLTAVTTLAAGDELVQWNASAGAARKITVANFIANSPNGGLAEKGAANTFTAAQVILPASGSAVNLVLNNQAGGTADLLQGSVNGATRYAFSVTDTSGIRFVMASANLGANRGREILIERNSNATTPAAGHVQMVDLIGIGHHLWPDASGNLRIGETVPTNANDTSGTVVGTQTSTAQAKMLEDADGSPLESLVAVVEAARSGLRAWRYKSGSYNNERFPVGLVTDLAPRYGMDRDAEHPAGKSLNIPVAIGDLFRAVAYLAEQIGVEVENG